MKGPIFVHIACKSRPMHVSDWLHEPTPAELKRQVRRWKSLAVAALLFAAGIGIAFLITCHLR